MKTGIKLRSNRWILGDRPSFQKSRTQVHCDILWDDQVVGVAYALRTVDAGGGYTIGAWKTIYRDVARDVVDDVSAQLGQK